MEEYERKGGHEQKGRPHFLKVEETIYILSDDYVNCQAVYSEMPHENSYHRIDCRRCRSLSLVLMKKS